MISKVSTEAVPLPILVDDEFLPKDGVSLDSIQTTQPASLLAFYAKTLELYEIMNDVLLSLYKPISDDSQDDIQDFYFSNNTAEGEHTIFQLDHSLTRWERGIPPHLRPGSAAGAGNPIFFRQGIVLRARFVKKGPTPLNSSY